VQSDAPPALEAIAYDPQTSGGLLAAVDPAVLDAVAGFTPIGEVAAGEPRVTLI
jgi:hypothetical protein